VLYDRRGSRSGYPFRRFALVAALSFGPKCSISITAKTLQGKRRAQGGFRKPLADRKKRQTFSF
jgi:hypothetical protein